MTTEPVVQAKDPPGERPPFGRTIGLALLLLLGAGAALEALRIGVLLPGGHGIGSAGPGMFPLISALGVIAFSALTLATSIAAGGLPRVPGRPTHIPAGLVSVGYYVGAMVFYALVMTQLGFSLATALTVGFILRFAEGYRWVSTLAITVATVIACYLLFNVLLEANLPAGRLWR